MLDPERLEVRFNGEWLDMPMEDLFALLRTATVAQILERDDFAKRYAAREPISMLELLYPLLQGYDSVAVRADVELGGTDQKFNLLLARDIQRAYGQPEQVILTMPLLTGTDGERKMSKSSATTSASPSSPEEIYGKTLSIPDASLRRLVRAAARTAPPDPARPAGRQAGAGPGAGGALPRRRAPPQAAEEALRPRPRPRTSCPTRCRGAVPASDGGRSTCRRCWRRRSGSRPRRRGGRWPRAPSGSTASRSPAARSICPRRASTAGCCSSASAASRACAATR